MAVHSGQFYCQHDVCIGPPDLARIAAAPKSHDIVDSVTFYLDAAATRTDIYYFCIYQRGIPCGQIFLHDAVWQGGEGLIGYHLFGPEYRGHGVGTGALALIKEYVQTATSLTRLVIITGQDNQASQHIATKCGFRLIGPAREDPGHLLVFRWDVPRRPAMEKQ